MNGSSDDDGGGGGGGDDDGLECAFRCFSVKLPIRQSLAKDGKERKFYITPKMRR